MGFADDKCKEQIRSQGIGRLMELSLYWVAGREFCKAYESKEALANFDASCKDAAEKLASDKTGKLQISYNEMATSDKQKAFFAAMESFLQDTPTCPGWSNSTCSMNWGEFACFCSAAAKTLTNEQIKELGATQPAGEPIQYTCDPSIKSDPIYSTTSTTTTTPLTATKSNWLNWALGGAAAVVGLGLIGYVLTSEKSASRNPEETFKTFKHRSGRYLTLIGTKNGNLILRPTREGIEEAKEMMSNDRGTLSNLADMLESHIGNGWDYIQPEEIGALTDATIIAQNVERNDYGDLVHVDRVYAHMNYAVEDPIEKWAAGKDVVFQGYS